MLVTIYQINVSDLAEGRRSGTGPNISFDASPFDTVGSMLENINKYRGPDNQIRDIYLDPFRKQKASADSWLLFNTIFYIASVDPSPSGVAGGKEG